jgi:hypothetical protein
MVEPIEIVEAEEAAEAPAEAGSTAVLTEEGWQVTDYEEPGPDWRLLGDGSWESPDRHTRSFPVDTATGE